MNKGIYMVGFFSQGKKCWVDITKKKPFEINAIRGEVIGRAHHLINNRNKCFVEFPKEWFFLEDITFSKIKNDKSIQNLIQNIFNIWCKKYKRKSYVLFKNVDEAEEEIYSNVELCEVEKDDN